MNPSDMSRAFAGKQGRKRSIQDGVESFASNQDDHCYTGAAKPEEGTH